MLMCSGLSMNWNLRSTSVYKKTTNRPREKETGRLYAYCPPIRPRKRPSSSSSKTYPRSIYHCRHKSQMPCGNLYLLHLSLKKISPFSFPYLNYSHPFIPLSPMLMHSRLLWSRLGSFSYVTIHLALRAFHVHLDAVSYLTKRLLFYYTWCLGVFHVKVNSNENLSNVSIHSITLI